MNQRLLLIRHSAVQIEPEKPAHEWTLSDEGRARCRRLARQLASHQPTTLVTSTEAKAAETGQILAAEWGIPWHTTPNLHEHDRQGLSYFTNKAAFEAVVADFFARPDELVMGRETAEQARERFETAVSQTLSYYPDDIVAIVAHGTVLTLLIAHHNPVLSPFPFWQTLTLPCAFVLSRPDLALQDAIYHT